MESPCKACSTKQCPCDAYDGYLDKILKMDWENSERNELLDEIRTDAPSPIMQGSNE